MARPIDFKWGRPRTAAPEKLSPRERLRLTFDVRLPLRLAWESAPKHLVSIAPLKVIQGVLPLASLYLMKVIIDAFTFAVSSGDPMSQLPRVVFYIVIAGLVGALGTVLGGISGLIGEAQGMIVGDHVQGLIQDKCLDLDLEFFEDPDYYDTLQRARQEGGSRPVRTVQNLTALVEGVVNLVAMMGLLLSFSPFMGAVMFIAAIPSVFMRLKYTDIRYRWQRERTERNRMVGAYDALMSGLGHAKEVRLYQLGGLLQDRWLELRRSLRGEYLDLARQRTVAGFWAQMAGALIVFGGVVLIARGALLGAITVGSMVMYYQAFQRGLSTLRSLMMGLADLYEGNLFLTNLQEFFQQTRRISEPALPKPIARPITSGIRFEGVSFRYPRCEKLVLKDIDMTLAPGEVVAVVGENGSGKTTMMKLLCRLYDPENGRILLDGVDLREYSTLAVRREIGVIFQDFARYPVTARENIWFGDLTKEVDGADIEEAARRAGIHDTITGLPKGYDTLLGRWFKGGEELSIGQWQKIALARAFLRDSQIIVLDEPTSSMDARSEYEVFVHFRQLLKGRSAIIVSHRFSTVRLADRIYVVEEGRVIEHGSHEDLVRADGVYAKMYALQAAAFR
ncbi:ABC transporter ATP-binding protein [Candidatus Fermentibacteria bacterium]|nr:ABC transporter ATP-binding protein [Candidatus Fermentibacteria bacterium]